MRPPPRTTRPTTHVLHPNPAHRPPPRHRAGGFFPLTDSPPTSATPSPRSSPAPTRPDDSARSIAESGTIRLPFGNGRTSPIVTDDIARVAATVLTDPRPHVGRALELTGPRSEDMNGVANEYARALSRPV